LGDRVFMLEDAFDELQRVLESDLALDPAEERDGLVDPLRRHVQQRAPVRLEVQDVALDVERRRVQCPVVVGLHDPGRVEVPGPPVSAAGQHRAAADPAHLTG
jgi:hypothetical protein